MSKRRRPVNEPIDLPKIIANGVDQLMWKGKFVFTPKLVNPVIDAAGVALSIRPLSTTSESVMLCVISIYEQPMRVYNDRVFVKAFLNITNQVLKPWLSLLYVNKSFKEAVEGVLDKVKKLYSFMLTRCSLNVNNVFFRRFTNARVSTYNSYNLPQIKINPKKQYK